MTTQQSRSVVNSQTIYACHCCSRCANPVITRLTVRTAQTGNVGILGTKESELRSQAAAEQASSMKILLDYLASPKAGGFPGETVEGMDSPCPVCSNIEPWQTRELSGKAAPIQTFLTLQESYAWAQGILRRRKAAAELAAADPAVMQRGQERLRAIDEALRACEEEKSSGAAAKELAALQEKEAALDEQFKAMSAFNKDKKQVKADLDLCRASLVEAQSRYHAVAASEDAKAAALMIEQAELSLYGKALTNRALLHENKHGLALSFAAGDGNADESVSLAPLPVTGRHSVSEYETENREPLIKAVSSLNDTLIAAQGKEESDV